MSFAKVLSTDAIGAPEGFEREVSARAVKISWRGAGNSACLWAGFVGLVLCALLLAASAAIGLRDARALAAVGGALAAGSAYLLLAGWLNRTVLILRRKKLVIGQRPLPCPSAAGLLGERAQKTPALDVYRVWIEAQPTPPGRDGQEPVYGLLIMTISAGRKELLTRLSLDGAAYLERELRAHLELKI